MGGKKKGNNANAALTASAPRTGVGGRTIPGLTPAEPNPHQRMSSLRSLPCWSPLTMTIAPQQSQRNVEQQPAITQTSMRPAPHPSIFPRGAPSSQSGYNTQSAGTNRACDNHGMTDLREPIQQQSFDADSLPYRSRSVVASPSAASNHSQSNHLARQSPVQLGATHAPSQAVASSRKSTNEASTNAVVDKQATEAQHEFATLLDKPKTDPGKDGLLIAVQTNHFSTNLRKIKSIYRYDVKVAPVQPIQRRAGGTETTADTTVGSRKIRRLLYLLLAEPTSRPFFDKAATDYAQYLVSLTPIMTAKRPGGKFKVHLLEEGQTQTQPSDRGRDFYVMITPTGDDHQLDVQKLLSFVQGGARCAQEAEIVNSLNLIVTRRPLQENSATLVGKDRHFCIDPQSDQRIGNGLRAKKGSSRSVRMFTDGVFLQINTSTAAFYQHGNLYQLLRATGQYHDQNLRVLEKFITGLRVRTTYGKRRMYSIWGFSTASAPGRPTPDNVRFDQYNDQGRLVAQNISVRAYFQNRR
jgi:N-terminal domain of argonaute/Argonaute linker 1 domain